MTNAQKVITDWLNSKYGITTDKVKFKALDVVEVVLNDEVHRFSINLYGDIIDMTTNQLIAASNLHDLDVTELEYNLPKTWN